MMINPKHEEAALCGIACEAHGHTFIWRYLPGLMQEAMRTAGQMAANPEVPLTWVDAKQITDAMQKIDQRLKSEKGASYGQ